MKEAVFRPVKKLLDWLHELTCIAGGLIVFSMGFLMLAVVIMRKYFDYNFEWGFPFLTFMLVWGTFVMLGSVNWKDRHIAISVLSRLLFRRREPTVRHALENMIGLYFCIFMAYHSWGWVDNLRDLGYVQYVGNDTYKEWIPAVIMPAGFIVGAIFYFERLIGQLRELYSRLIGNRSIPPSTPDK